MALRHLSERPYVKPDRNRAGVSMTSVRILLADQDAETRVNLTRLLTEHGWDVDAVANSDAALEAARRNAPDLLLTEALISGLDGRELVAVFRSDPSLSLVPIILMSTRTDENSWADGAASGADDYLGKPLGKRELLGRVSAHIAMSRQRRAEAGRSRRADTVLKTAADLVGLSPDSWNPTTGALVWDDRLRAMWGLLPGATVDYATWIDAIHADDRQEVETAVRSCMDPDGNGSWEIEYRVVGVQDGIERWASTRGQTTFADRRPIDFIGGTIEITDKKRAEKRLIKSEAQLSAILRQLPMGVAFYGRDGRIGLSNDAFKDYVQKQPSRGSERAELWGADPSVGSSVTDKDGGSKIELLHTQVDRHAVWTRVSVTPVKDDVGAVIGAVETIQNIDQERRLELALLAGEKRVSNFLEHSKNVFWILDTETRKLDHLGPASQTIWGKNSPTMTDVASWSESLHPEDRAFALAALNRSLEGEGALSRYRIIRPDGTVRWIRHTFFPILDEQGPVQRVGGIAEDITGDSGEQVYVIVADERSRRDLASRLEGGSYDVKSFSSARAFLDVANVLLPGCLVLDIRALQADWLTLLNEMRARLLPMPVIVMGGSAGDVDLAVRAMKAGAADWLVTPYKDQILLTAVASSLAVVREQFEAGRAPQAARLRIAGMTPREREVLDGIVSGETNKAIGRRLGISPRTVELHRAHVMERLGVRTLPEAVLLAASANLRSKV